MTMRTSIAPTTGRPPRHCLWASTRQGLASAAARAQSVLRLAAVAVALASPLAPAWAVPAQTEASPWARVRLPQDLQTFDMGQGLGVNGVPLWMRGFVSDLPAAQVVARFKASLGEPVVVNVLQGKTVLGRMLKHESGASHYLTVQIEGVAGGSRGVLAVADMTRAADTLPQSREAQARWQNRLPAGSKVLNQVSSRDGDKVSTYLVASNRHAPRLNADRLIELMQQDGYTLERESHTDDVPARARAANQGEGIALFFKGADREAMAVVSRTGAGRTSIVINTVSQIKAYP